MRVKIPLARTFIYLSLVVILLLLNLPSIYMVSSAFKSKTAVLTDLSFFPKKLSVENFINVLAHTTFGRSVLNSAITALVITGFCAVLASTTGYAISRFRSPLLRVYSVMLLVFQMFPGILILIPLFRFFSWINLVNTRLSVVLGYSAMLLPFSIWMMRGFFDTIPFEIEESAMIDGCSHWGTFLRIIVPLSLPGLTSVGIFCFINSWNEYMLASVFLRDDEIQTMTLGLQKFVQQFNSDWAALMAASTIALVPTIFFLVFAQQYIIRGLTAGAVKG